MDAQKKYDSHFCFAIHSFANPMNFILFPSYLTCPPSCYGLYSKGRRGRQAFSIRPTLAEINNPPLSVHVSLSRKGMPGPGLRSFTMVSCMLLSHGSQAVQTSRFSAARVPMHTCGM
jgi:hypothetical protein